MTEFKFFPESIPNSKEDEKKYAWTKEVIKTSEQEYVDPDRRYAHNDLYPSARVEVIKIDGDRTLVKDDTGEFRIPTNKLDFDCPF